METDTIERACLKILSVLKSGRFTRPELEMLYALFSKLVGITKKMLGE